MLKPLPIGTAVFRDIIQGGYLYIDKTRYIYELVRMYKGVYFLSRPRRFGKSLMISTLSELFQGNRALFLDSSAIAISGKSSSKKLALWRCSCYGKFLERRLSKIQQVTMVIAQQIKTFTTYRKSLSHECVTDQRRITVADVTTVQAHAAAIAEWRTGEPIYG